MKLLRLLLVLLPSLLLGVGYISSVDTHAVANVCDGGIVNWQATSLSQICPGHLVDPDATSFTGYTASYPNSPIWYYGGEGRFSANDSLVNYSWSIEIGNLWASVILSRLPTSSLEISNTPAGYLGSNLSTSGDGIMQQIISPVWFIGSKANLAVLEWFYVPAWYLGTRLSLNPDWVDAQVVTPIGSYGSTFSLQESSMNMLLTKRFVLPVGYLKDTPRLTQLLTGRIDKLDFQLAAASPDPENTKWIRTPNIRAAKKEITASKDAVDPVELSTGEFIYDNTLMQFPSTGLGYNFSIKYRSQVSFTGSLGYNWTHTYDRKLYQNTDASVTYQDGDGAMHTFMPSGDGYEYLSGYEANLSKTSSGGYLIAFKNGNTETFNDQGLTTQSADANGNTLTYSYNALGQLSLVQDRFGRTATYEYTTSGYISRVTDNTGRSVILAYYDGTTADGYDGDLKSIVLHNSETSEKTIGFTYFKSSDPSLAHNLVSLIDSKGQIYVTNTYDTNDRVLSQHYGDGTGSFEYTLADIHADDTPTSIGSGAVIGQYIVKNRATDKEGNITEYTYNRLGNVIKKEVFAKDGASSNITRYTYDAVWRITAEIFPRGNGTIWGYNTAGKKIEARQKSDISAPNNDSQDIITRYSYDATTNKLLTTTLPDGSVITNTYDSRGNLTRVTQGGVVLALGGSPSTIPQSFVYSDRGEILSTQDAEGNFTQFAYSGANMIQKTTGSWASTITESYTYDAHGNRTSLKDGENNTTTYEYDPFDRLIATTSPKWVRTEYGYDANNNRLFERVLMGDGKIAQTQYTYDILDQVITKSTHIDETRTLNEYTTYTKNGKPNTLTIEGGPTKIFVYSPDEKIISETLSASGMTSAVTTYEYDANSNPIKITDPLGRITRSEYDGFDRLIKTISPSGVNTLYSYDVLWNLSKTETFSPTGVRLSLSETVTNSLKKPLAQTLYQLDIQGNVIAWAAHRTQEFAYNKNSAVILETNPLGGVTSSQYNSLGQLTSKVDPTNTTTAYIYNPRGLVAQETTSLSGSTQTRTAYGYDFDGRMIQSTRYDDQTPVTTQVAYDALGNPLSQTDPAGNTTTRTFDLRGKLLSESQSLSGTLVTTSYEYDILGNKTKLIDPKWNTTIYTYDGFGRKTQDTLPDGSKTYFTYDLANQLTQKIDPNGSVFHQTFDLEGRLTERTIERAAGVAGVNSETFTYDALGRLTNTSDNLGHTVALKYDSLGNKLEELSNGRTITNTYNPAGNALTIGLPSGKNIAQTFDNLGRLTHVAANTGAIIDYQFTGNTLTNTLYGNGVTQSRTYDGLMRLGSLNATASWATNINRIYTYDSLDNIIADGQSTHTYDALSRLTSSTSSVLPAVTSSFNYDISGNRTTQQATNAPQTLYETNALDQYTNLSGTNTWALRYDLNGNLLENARFVFVYDAHNRLVSVSEKVVDIVPPATGSGSTGTGSTGSGETSTGSTNSGTTSETGTWSTGSGSTGSGEILPETGTGSESGTGSQNSSGSTSSGMTSTGGTQTGSTETGSASTGSTESGSTSLPETNTGGTSSGETSSGSGDLTGSGASVIPEVVTIGSFEETGTGTSSGSGYTLRLVATYTYDTLSRRLSKDVGLKHVEYAYSGEQLVFESTTEDGVSTTIEYVYGIGGMDDVIASVSSSEDVRYFLHDHLGSTVGVMDESGQVLEEYAYDVFWLPYAKSGSGGFVSGSSLITSRLFTGREYDAETGLYYYRARTYDAALGRFLQRDPIGTDDQVNMYTYVRNNPMKWVDPSGKEKEVIANIFRGAIGDFNQQTSLDEWRKLNFGAYDLTHYKDHPTVLTAPKSWFNKDHTTSDGNILIAWKYYSIWEVSNILVWFNAYNAWYTLGALQWWAMAYTMNVEANWRPQDSNWPTGEYFDSALYTQGYELAKQIQKNSSALTTEMVVSAIEQWTTNRYTQIQNPSIHNYVDLGVLNTVNAWWKWATALQKYSSTISQKIYDSIK